MKKFIPNPIKIGSLLLFIACFNFLCFVQANAQTDLPKLIPPSPTTAALFKFQDYPVDYSTGLAQISIPIYDVKSGSLSVPISISYHAAGRKVYDQDGPVALGWSLSAGGIISRTTHGTPDFGNYKFPYPFKIDNISNYNDLAYLQRIMRYQGNSYCGTLFPYYDTEYDIFSYSFPGNSGKFIFKDDNSVKTPVLLPYKPFVITTTNPSPNVVGFEITDDKGVYYKFSPAEFTQLDEYSPTAWNLDKIISADKTDTISFVYTGGVETRRTISQTITYIDDWNEGTGAPENPNPEFTENTSQANYNVSRISEIKFKQGKVKFNLVNGTLRIDNIQVLNLKDEVIKTIKFNSSSFYFQAEINNATNKLDAVEFRDNLNNTVEKYKLEYYPVVNSTINGNPDPNGPINVRYRDWWGYYNNSGQHDMLPQYTVASLGFQQWQQIGNPYGNRQPSLEPLKSGILKKITFPTGGSSEFIYQQNQCIITGGSGFPEAGPGLRIYQIKSTDGSGIFNLRTFKYGNNESGYGYLELLPDLSTLTNEITSSISFAGSSWIPAQLFGPYFHRERYFSSDIYEELSELADRPVMYQQVTEYKGTESSNTGKSVYKYDDAPWGAAGLFPKKHIYNYNYWDNPSLIMQEDYEKVNGGYQKVKSIGSSYTPTKIEYIRGLHVQRRYALPQGGYGLAIPPGSSTDQPVCSEQFAAYSGQGPVFNGPIPIYSFHDYRIEAGVKNLTSTTETVYTDAGNISTTTSYAYNAKNLVSATSTTTSKGETVQSTIKYPFDYTGNSVLTQMVNLNMLGYPVEQIETRNANHTKSVKTNYYNWGTTNPMLAPQTIETKQGANSYEIRLRYHAYDDNGNPLSVSKENDSRSSYIWGYKNSYPVAEVKNAKHNEIFFDSFEEGIGWDANLTAYDNAKSYTGNYSGRIDKPSAGKLFVHSTKWLSISLTAPTKYHYSGWVYSNGPSVQLYLFMKRAGETGYNTYIDNVQTTTTGKWVYIEKDFNVPADVVSISLRLDNNGGGTVWFDDLRLHPSNAFMTTYTYDPLIGMTSQTDINNYSSYYEYDGAGRLKLIKDFNGNILKTFKYQYSNPQ